MWRVNGHNKHAVTTLQNIQIIGLVWEGGLLRTKNTTSHKVTVCSVHSFSKNAKVQLFAYNRCTFQKPYSKGGQFFRFVF